MNTFTSDIDYDEYQVFEIYIIWVILERINDHNAQVSDIGDH